MKLNKFFSLAAALLCASSLSATTLQELIPAGATDGTVITVSAGTYDASDLTGETRTLIFQAEEKGSVILDGAHAARCADLSDSITLDGFVIQNGLAECGGGVRGGTVINSVIQNCSADFGGGAYKTNVRATILIGNKAEFFGMAAYGGTMMSCRVEGNASATYGGGMGALFGVKVANTSVTGNTATRDFSGALASTAQNMIFLNNTATKGLYEGAPMKGLDLYGGSTPEDYKAVSNDATIFNDAAAGDYTLNLTAETEEKLKEQGDPTLGGNYDDLWYKTDLAGRPRLLGTQIDIGPYEIAETFTVECDVEGVGAVDLSTTSVQEGDDVTFTASKDSNYPRDFDGFYVNGELITTATTMTYAPVKSDVIVARFKGLTADTGTLANILNQLHPSTREVVTLADGTYDISGLTKAVVFTGTTIDGTIINATADQQKSVFVNVTISGTPANATIHRSLLKTVTSGTNLTITSSVIASDCTNISGVAANVTAYGTLPTGLTTQVDCLAISGTTNTVAGAILAKNSDSIDAGENNSDITPYDNYDIAGRPRVMGEAIDKGAHECHYISLTVQAEGYYTALDPDVGTTDKLAGDKLTLTYESPREFKGWTLADGTAVESPYTLPEEDVTLIATFAGFDLTPETAASTDLSDAQAADTITLAAGTYTQEFNTPAKIVGMGDQDDVILTGTVTGGAVIEAVTLQNATLGTVTLNRCRVETATMATNGSVTATNSIFIDGTVSGTFTNNTFDGTEVSGTQTNCLEKSAAAELDYQLAEGDEAIDAGEIVEDIGALDYYGNPRINNGTIDVGAAEYQWPPYVVTINVIGHGLVSPRGAVDVIRGETLTFTAKEDPDHKRGAPTVVGEGVTGTNGTYTVTPSADMTITVTFDGITVGTDKDYADLADAVLEAQDGDTITVDPGTYGAIDVKGKAIKIVASSNDSAETIIDAQGLTRAVNLADGAEIIGFTIQNGVASEGAGVNGGIVRRCVIKNNTLSYNGTGAGICNVKLAESCLIYDNGSATVARSNGGGAANSYLLNCTVARNTASTGAGLYECTAKNCVVALNADLSGVAADWYGETVAVDPSACCTPIEGSNTVIDATTIFVAPELNDWRLREGVDCIDAGTDDDDLSTLDAAGNDRKYNGTAVDMGALEWNSPDYQITVDFHGPATVTATYGETEKAITEKTTLSVPRDVETITFAWASSGSVARTFKGIFIDGESVSEDETTEWTIATENTVYATLVFTAEDLAATTSDVAAVLADATAGETVRLADGIYTDKLTIKEDVTVIGNSIDGVILQGGATLASGALLTNVSATAQISGPTDRSAELSYAKVYDVTDTAVQNLVVKTVLIRDSVNGVYNSTVYLSTIVNNTSYGVVHSTVYGSAMWNNGEDTLESTVVDSYIGENPAFTLPAPDGDDYTLTGRSPLIDLAGTPAWEGFEATDFETDLAGEARPSLFAYDAGAYEYQAPEDAEMADYWTWYGSSYDVDGNIGDAAWTRMQYGAPQKFADGDEIYLTDRTGFQSATIGIDASSYVSKMYLNISRELSLVDAGGLLMTEAIVNQSSGTLNLVGPMMIGGQFVSSTGKINVVDGASVIVGGLWQNTGSMPVTISGGTISTEQAYFGNTTKLNQTGGTFNFGTLLSLRDTATATFAGGTVTGGRISVAQGGRTAIYFTGADVTVERLETGDTSGARYGNIEQTGGTVKLIGTATEKNAPLHISHWPGESHYYLKGGELIVPNSEVRLGRDGNGCLHIEGGVAKLKSVAITGGTVFMKGGTYHALATQTLTANQTVSSTYEAADGTVLTLNLTTTDGTMTKLASGKFKMTTVPTNVNLTLGTGVTLEATNAAVLGDGYILTLPGNGAAAITGDYTAGTIAIDPATAPEVGVKTAVLTVSGTITADGLTSAQPDYYTFSVEEDTVYVTVNTALPEETTTVTTPTITVDGDTTWSDSSKWSSTFVVTEDAIVKVVSEGTLSIDPTEQVKIDTVTFDIPEGVTLTVTATTMPHANTIVKTGLGTLRLETLFNYSSFTEGEGILEMAAAGQTFAGAAIEAMALIAAANVNIEGVATLNLTIADGKTVTLKEPVACTGTIIGEGSATIAVETSAMTFTGTVDVAGALTCSGTTLTLSGDVAVDAISGTYAFGTLNSLYLGSGSLTCNATLADCFEKSGAGTVAFNSPTYQGSAIFGGPVSFNASQTIAGALHFKEGAIVTMPYNATLTARSEIRVEPTVSFILTGTPTAGTYTLLTNDLTVGLQTDNLASLSVALETAPTTAVTTTLVLENSALKCVIEEPTAKTWTGASDTNWSLAANWSDETDFVDGDAVIFNASAKRDQIVLDKMVAPSIISIAGRDFTFTGGTNSYGFTGNVTATQGSNTTVIWETFMKEGSYTIYNGATAKIAVDGGWAYSGHFIGDGTIIVQAAGTNNILDLVSPSVGFTGTYQVESGAILRLMDDEAAYAAKAEITGSLNVIAPATVRAVEMMAEDATITIGVNWPLTVRESITGYNGESVKVNISDMPTVSGDWEIMYLPEGCATTFELAGEAPTGYATFLSVAFNKLYLSIRPDSDIAWGLNINNEYGWVINGTRQIPSATTEKNVYLNELTDVASVEQAMPESPLTLTVKAKTTKYTLTGDTTITPTQITLLSETSATLAVPTTPGAIANDGVLTIEGKVLDLTETTLSGHGIYVAGTDGTILVPAQTLAETTATFTRAGGTIQVVVDADCTLPDGNYPTGGDGKLTKTGNGTLYITPNALANSIDIQGGSVVMTGATAIKARYLKFEPHARFAASSGSLPPTGIGDIVTTLNGQRQPWPEGSKIVRFDSGVTNRIQIGVTGDSQNSVASDCTGVIENLFDNNPSTQFLWREWHAEYGLGGSYYRRNYFIVDAGEAGIKLTGYNIATPATLSAFFYKWDVSVANDISNWRPGTEVCGDLSNEDVVWQDIDVRENSDSYSALTASAWMSTGGYTARKLSGLYSELTGTITIASGAELNLEKLAGTTGILPDVAVLSSVTGEGTLTIPSNLTLDADTITVGTLKLAGSAPLTTPLTATTALTFNNLALSATYEQALLDSGSTEFLVATGFDGEDVPEVTSTLTLEAGESWATAIVEGDLYLYLVSSANVYATVSADTAWNNLAWTNAAGEAVTVSDWTTVESITIRATADATLSGLPAINTTAMPVLTAFNVDFGYITTKPTLTLAGSNAVALPTLSIKGQIGGVVKSTLSSLSITTLDGAAPYNGVGVEVMNALTASSYAYTGPGVLALYGTDAGIVINKRVTVPAARPLEIAGGTVKLSQEENFGTMVCIVQVNAGATLDVNGCAISNNTILAGGTLTNTGAEIPVNKRQTYYISLTADSTVSGTGNFMSLNSGYAWHSMNLNGHTLTKTGTNTFAICNATIVGANGTICAEEGTINIFTYHTNPTTNFQDVTLHENGGEITIAKNYALVGTLTLNGTIAISNTLSNSDDSNPGNLVVAGGDVSFSTAPTYAGSTTVKSGALFGAPSVAGDLIFEEGAIFKPVSGTVAMTVGGTLTSSETEVNLSSATDAGTSIPLITTGSAQELTADMIATTATYTPSVTNGTIYYTYVDMDGAYYWTGSASGNWEDRTWSLDGTGSNTYLSGSSKVTFTEESGEISLTRSSIRFYFQNISPVKVVTIPKGVTLNLPEPSREDYALTINGVTMTHATSKLVMHDYFATTLGNVAGGVGTFAAPASLLDTVGTINVGTLEITGSELPSTGPTNLTCTTVKISEAVEELIRSSTTASKSAFQIAQATSLTDANMPELVDANGEAIIDYVVKAVDGTLCIAVAGDTSVTAVQATVSGNNLTWSSLNWTDGDGTSVTPVWAVVNSVTLNAEAASTIALDVNVPNLQMLTVNGAYVVDLMPVADERLAGNSGTLMLGINNAQLYTGDVTAATTAMMVYSSSTGMWQIENSAVTTITAAITVAETVTLKTKGDLILSSADNELTAAAIEVVEGTLTLAAKAGSIIGDVTIASGATLTATTSDALGASTDGDTLVVNGTLNLNDVSWALSGWTVQMGAGATIAGTGASVDGQTLALNCVTDTTLVVSGADATLSAPIGATSNNITLTVQTGYDVENEVASTTTSLNWTGNTSSTIFNVKLVNIPAAMGYTQFPATVTMTGTKATKGLLTVGAANILAPTGTWSGSVTFEDGAILELGDSALHVTGVVTASGLDVTLPDDYTVGTAVLTSNTTLTGNMLAVVTKDDSTKMSGTVTSSTTDDVTTYTLSYNEGVIDTLIATIWGDIDAWDADANILWQNQATADTVDIDDVARDAVTSILMTIGAGTVSVATPIAELFPTAEISIEITEAIYALTVDEGDTATTTATVTGAGTIQKLGAGTLDLTTAAINNFQGTLDVDAGRVILAQGDEVSITSATCEDGAEILIKLDEIAAYTAGSGLSSVTVDFLTPDGKDVAPECVANNTFTPLNLVRDDITYVNVFRGTTDETDAVTTAETATAWYKSTDNASWTVYSGTLAPLLSNSSDLTNPALFDGNYMPTIAADAETGRKVVEFSTENTTTVEGWEPNISVCNNVDLTINKLVKLQSTSHIRVDETSKLTMAWNNDTATNANGAPTFYIKGEEGLTFTKTYNINGASTYYLYEAGSVKYATTVQGTHTIAGFTLDLGEGDYPAKTTTSRKLVSFTSSSATFSCNDGAATATDGTAMNKVDSFVAVQNVGDYIVTTGDDGVYVYYLGRSTVPPVYTWTGASGTDTNWTTAANWDVNAVPTSTDDVIIPAGATVTLTEAVTVNTLTVSATDATTAAVFSGEGSLTAATTAVNGDLDVSAVTASLGAVSVAEGKVLTVTYDMAAQQYTSLSAASGSLRVANDVTVAAVSEINAAGTWIVASGTKTTLPSGANNVSISTIKVESGATLDINGCYDITPAAVILADGAVLHNTTAIPGPAGKKMYPDLTLTGGTATVSGLSFSSIKSGHNNHTLYLNGGTLDFVMESGNTFYFTSLDIRKTTTSEATEEAGTLQVTSGTLQFEQREKTDGNTNLVIKSGAQVTLGTNYYFGSLAGEGTFNINSKSTQIGALNTDTVFTGTTSAGTLTKVGTGVLDLSKATINSTTFAITGGTLILPAGKEGAIEIPAETTVMLVLNEEQLATEYISSATGAEFVTFVTANDDGTYTEVVEGVNGNVYANPTVPTWIPTATNSTWNNAAYWNVSTVPTSGNIRILTSALAADIDVTIPTGFTSVEVKAHSSHTTKLAMASDATHPTITASGKVAFTPALLNDTTHVTIDNVTPLVIDTDEADPITRALEKTIVTTGTGTATVSGVISGGNALTVETGTLVLTAANTLTGQVIVQEGATLDITAETARLFSANWFNPGNRLRVFGTLRTRPWYYSQSLGAIGSNSGNVRLLGGTVEFPAGSDETGDQTRGFVVESEGATFVVPAGFKYSHRQPADGNFGITNNGTLTLTGEGTYQFNGNVSGTVSVAAGTTLAGKAGTFATLTLESGAILDATTAAIGATTLTELPAALTVKLAERPGTTAVDFLTTTTDVTEETLVEGTTLTLAVGEMADSTHYELVKTATGYGVRAKGICAIGDTYYTSLTEALTAVADDESGETAFTIALYDDVALAETLVIDVGEKTVTLDLYGAAMTTADTITPAIRIASGTLKVVSSAGAATITAATDDATSATATAILVGATDNNGTAATAACTLDVGENVTVSGATACQVVTGSLTGAGTLDGAVAIASAGAIVLDGTHYLTINGTLSSATDGVYTVALEVPADDVVAPALKISAENMAAIVSSPTHMLQLFNDIYYAYMNIEMLTATLSEDANISEIEWTYTEGETTVTVMLPDAGYYPCTLAATADVTVTMDTDAAFLETLTIADGSKITFAGEGDLTVTKTNNAAEMTLAVNADVDVSQITSSLGIVTLAADKELSIGENTTIGTKPTTGILNYVDMLPDDYNLNTTTLTARFSGTSSNATMLGATNGTLEIAPEATVTVSHLRVLNSEHTANNVTFNVNGNLVVDSVSTDPNVWAERESYIGILFGHWHGTATYNINAGGSLVGEAAYAELVYTAEAQTVNVNGGLLQVRGLYAATNAAANTATVNLTNGGTIALAECPTGGNTFVQNYGHGTLAAYSYNYTTGWTNTMPVSFTDAVNGTTLDPAGLTIAFSGTITDTVENGGAKIVVRDSTLVARESGTDVTGGVVNLAAATLPDTLVYDVQAGTLILPAGAEAASRVTVATDADATLILQLSEEEMLLGYTAQVPDGTTVTFYTPAGVAITENDGTSNGVTFTPNLNTWTATTATEGKYLWNDASNWSKGTIPGSSDAVKIAVSNAATMTLDAAVTVSAIVVEGEGSLTIEGEGTLTTTDAVSLLSSVTAPIEAIVGCASIDVADGKVLTVSSDTLIDNPDNESAAVRLPTITGEGTLVKTGTGSVTAFENNPALAVTVSEGDFHFRTAPNNPLNVTAEAGTFIRLTAWNVNFSNAANAITLKGGAGLVLANGPSTTLAGTITIADATETSAKIYGYAFAQGTLSAAITGSGTVEFAEGQAFSTTSVDHYPCQNAVTVTGAIATGVNVVVSDLENPVIVAASATSGYTGTIDIVSGATLKLAAANALSATTTITGEGTLLCEGFLPTNRTGLTDGENWTGTVLLDTVQPESKTGYTFHNLGNANSTLELNNFATASADVYLNEATELPFTLKLSGDNYITNGNSSRIIPVSGALTGTGSLTFSGNPAEAWKFTGETSGFTGNLSVTGNRRAIFGDVGAVSDGTITIGTAVTVPATWTASGGVHVLSGGTIGGTGTIAGNLTLNSGSTLNVVDVADLLTVNGTVSGSGATVTLPEGVTTPIPLLQSTTEMAPSVVAATEDYIPTVTATTVDETTTYTITYEANAAYYTDGLYATVSADGWWTDLTWTDVNGTAVSNIIWSAVQKVYLTLEANATLFVNVDLSALTMTQVTGSGTLQLSLYGGTAAGSGTIAVGEGVTLVSAEIYAADANLSVTGVDGVGGVFALANYTNTTISGTITTAAAVTFKSESDMTFTSTSNTFVGPLEVVSGTLTLATASQGLKNTVTIASGAKMVGTSGDSLSYNTYEGITASLTVNGELALADNVRWTVSAKSTVPVTLGAGAKITGTGGVSEGQTMVFDFFHATSPMTVTGAGAVIEGPIGAHDNGKSLAITFAEGASLELKGGTTSTNFGITTTGAGSLIVSSAVQTTGTLAIGENTTLMGTGSVSGPVTFAETAKLGIADTTTPLQLLGNVTASNVTVVLPEGELPETIPLIRSLTEGALTTDMVAPDTTHRCEVITETTETTEGDETVTTTTYTLSYVKLPYTETGLYATVDTQTFWSHLSWSDVNGTVYATEEIDWAAVKKVYLTVDGESCATWIDIDLTGLETLSVDGDGDVTILVWGGTAAGNGTLAIAEGVKVMIQDGYASTANLTVTGAGTVSFIGNHSGTITLNDTVTLRAETSDITLSGVISGTGSIEVVSGYDLTLTADNNANGAGFTGNVIVNSGATLTTTNGFAYHTSNPITVNGIWNVGGGNYYRHVTGGGTINVTADTVLGSGTGSTKNGIQDFTGSLTVAEGATLNLACWGTAYNLTDCNLTVNGTLKDGQGKVTITIADGKTLSGKGEIRRPVTFNSGATLDATAGVLTVNGSVTSTNTAITAADFGPVLTAANVDASTFTTTLADAMVSATDTALFLVKRPSLEETDSETGTSVETISDTAAAIIAEAAAAEGVYEVTMDSESDSTDGLELFTNVDLELTVDEEDETKATVKVAYDFGIADVTVQNLTTATTNITAEGTYVVLTVKVDNTEHNAGYGDATKLVISMNGTEVDAANVTVIDNTTIGVMKLAIPYETLEAAELTDSETFIFTVRATNEAETTEAE